MKKQVIIILLVLVAFISTAVNRTKSPDGVVLTGQSTLSVPMRFAVATDYLSANDTFYINVTAKQYVTCIQTVSLSLDSISGNPSISIQLQGKVFTGDSWSNLGSPSTWDDMADNPLAISYTTANTYRYFRVMMIASGTTQHSHITAFEFQDTHTSGGTKTTGVNIGTSQAIWGTTAMTVGTGSQTVSVNSSDWDISATGAMTGIGAITTDGLITGTAGATLSGAAINLNASSNFATNIGTGSTNAAVTIGGNSNTVAVNSSDWDITTTGVMTGIGAITSDGVITATGGLTLATVPSVFYAAGGAPIIAATGTDVACANGTKFWVEVNVPYNVTLTGVGVLIGSVGGTDSICVQLHNSAGVQVATNRTTGGTATLLGTTATFQNVAFASTYAAVAGRYYVSVQFNGTTGKFRTYPIVGSKFIAGTVAGTWGTMANITPGTTFTADKGPICFLY